MESSSSENFDWKEGRQALMRWECWESFALSYSQHISLLPSWDGSVTWMFSVFSSQEPTELFVVNNIHGSFDPKNAYAREQLDTWEGEWSLYRTSTSRSAIGISAMETWLLTCHQTSLADSGAGLLVTGGGWLVIQVRQKLLVSAPWLDHWDFQGNGQRSKTKPTQGEAGWNSQSWHPFSLLTEQKQAVATSIKAKQIRWFCLKNPSDNLIHTTLFLP